MTARIRAGLGVVLLAGLLSSCGPVPQPFRSDVSQAPNPVQALEGFRVIYVPPIKGATRPMAKLLATSVAQYLNTHDIPASTHQPKQHRKDYWTLEGSTRPIPYDTEPSLIALTQWNLRDQHARQLTDHKERTLGEPWQWEYGDPRILYAVGKGVAGAIAPFIRKPDTSVIAAKPDKLQVCIAPVSGAPGDGNYALLRALRTALSVRGFDIVSDEARAERRIRGTVELTDLQGGAEHIRIVWGVEEPDGVRIGDAVQENDIAAGSLNARWGAIAGIAAAAVLDGVIDLLTSSDDDQTPGGLSLPPSRQLRHVPGRALPPPE